MKLWDVLYSTQYTDGVIIYKNNDYSQYIHLYDGSILDARADPDVFDYLMNDVIHVKGVSANVLYIEIAYKEQAEKLYSKDYIKKWDRYKKETRPWRFYNEVEEEIKKWLDEYDYGKFSI